MHQSIKFLMLFVAGALLMFLLTLVQQVPHASGEYYFSSLLVKNYTIVAGLLFFLTGIACGYMLRLNPWLAGLSLILIFPLTTIIEMIVYKGSHNLFPFELAIHFLFALPAIIGLYLGQFIFYKYSRQKF